MTSESEVEASPGAQEVGRTSIEPVVLARAVRGAVEAVRGVAKVSGGDFALIGTYGPGEIVPGVAVSQADVAVNLEIHLVASYPIVTALPALANQVRRAAYQAVERLGLELLGQIDVVFDDLEDVKT